LITIEGPPSNEICYALDEYVALELCSGREGDDAYARVERGEPSFEALLDVLLYSVGNLDGSDEESEPGRHSATPNREDP